MRIRINLLKRRKALRWVRYLSMLLKIRKILILTSKLRNPPRIGNPQQEISVTIMDLAFLMLMNINNLNKNIVNRLMKRSNQKMNMTLKHKKLKNMIMEPSTKMKKFNLKKLNQKISKSNYKRKKMMIMNIYRIKCPMNLMNLTENMNKKDWRENKK